MNKSLTQFSIFVFLIFPLLLTGTCVTYNASVSAPVNPLKIIYPELIFNPPKPMDFRDTLSNGIIVYIVEDHRLPVFDITAVIRTGSIFDPDSLSGLAALALRGMRTGGTKSFTGDQIDEKVEFIAAKLSANASATNATVSLSVLKKYMDEGLNLFVETLKYPVFSENKISLEKKNIYEEISHYFDSPNSTLNISFNKILYNNFPAGNIPDKKSIEAITIKNLKDFHDKFFKPQNIYLAVSGDISRKEILNTLNKSLGDWKKDSMVNPPVPKWTQPPRLRKVFLVKQKINQSFIRMGERCIQRPDPDYYALSVLNYILGGSGFSSRLTQKVRSDEGLSYDVDSYVESNYFYPGTFSVSLQTKSKSTSYAIKLCMEEIENIKNKPVSIEELSNAKKSLVESFPSLFSSAKETALNFCLNEYWKRPFDHFDVYRSKINALTAEDLKQAAVKYIHPDSLAIVVVGDLTSSQENDSKHNIKLSDFGQIDTINTENLVKR